MPTDSITGSPTNPEDYGFTNVTDSAQGQSVDPDEYLFWDDLHPTTAGHYQIAAAAFALLDGTALPPALALNLSTRLNVGTGDNVLIGGFIVNGTDSKQVIVRGIGPSLAVNGVPSGQSPGRSGDRSLPGRHPHHD